MVHEVAKEELRPVVRDAITEDVLRSIDGLMRLSPRAVELIAADLESSNEAVRQKAYTLLLRYTLGNPAVAPTPEATTPPMQVVFNMPQPGDDAPEALIETPAAEVELEECCVCHEHKAPEQFIAGSDRCQTCQDALDERVRSEFG